MAYEDTATKIRDTEQDILEDVSLALVLMEPGDPRDMVCQSFENMGCQCIFAKSATAAIDKMRFVNFTAVIFQANFEGEDINASIFHNHMCSMAMSKRRYIYYILIGPQFQTLYNLEALSNSANVVIHNSDIDHFQLLLKKGMRDYEELFGPYFEALKRTGRK